MTTTMETTGAAASAPEDGLAAGTARAGATAHVTVSPRLPEHWPFSISFSALMTYERCPRRWWLSAPGAWGGWPGGHRRDDPLAVAAYEGKHVWPLAAAVGIAVHAAAEWAVRRVVAGARDVTYDALWRRVRDTLNGAATRDLGAFVLRPKMGILLQPYFQQPLPADEVALARTVAQSACRRLATVEVLEEVRGCGRRDLLATERLLSASMVVDGEDVTVFGKGDLLFVSSETTRIEGIGLVAPGPDGIPVYADFKTGSRAAADDPRTRCQLGVGAWLAAASGLVRAHDVVGIVGRVCDLSPHGLGDTTTLLGARDLSEAEAWLREGARALLRLPRDVHGVPLLSACPRRPSQGCATCPMRGACELSRAAEGAQDGAARRSLAVRPAERPVPTNGTCGTSAGAVSTRPRCEPRVVERGK